MKSTVVVRAMSPLLRASCLLVLLACPTVQGGVPPEVEDLQWCPGAKDCLGWSTADGATSYTLYRGHGPDLAGLLDASLDSCTLGSFVENSAGGIEDPAPGSLHWYLVTGSNLDGEGEAGQGSSGARVVDSSGTCGPAGGLVINEIDYDQPGTDFVEFIEIRNGSDEPRDLAGVVVILVNGLSSSEYLRVELSDAGPSLAAGAYLVVGTAQVLATLPAGTLSVALPSSSNNIQNGAPDGVALFDTSASVLLDALSYEGSITAAQFDDFPGTYNLVEGTPATAEDSNSVDGSLARFPDGSDTNDADSDWSFNAIPSPGTPNPAP